MSFLVDIYGFHIEKIDEKNVIWHKNEYYVELGYDRYSYEVSLLYYKKDDNFQDRDSMISYSFDEILPCVKIFPQISFFKLQTING
jgi:hypothetical protein